MIVSSKNQKTYGVIHTENYFSFLGFCKKVNSDKIQKVDVLIDNILIDTIVADKHIEKIEDIYELKGFGFNYVLPNEYIGQKNLISFKNHETKEDLQNSPYELIQANHPKFNEMAFLNSIKNSIIEQKIQNLYCKNNIGFLATEENLENKDFIHYIEELLIRFPQVTFKAFYCDIVQIESLKNIFKNNINRFISLPLKNIYDLVKNVEIIICNEVSSFDRFVFNLNISIHCANILVIYIYLPHSKLSLSEYDEILKETCHPLLKFPQKFGLDLDYLKAIDYSVTNIFRDKFNINMKDCILVEDFYYYQFIKLGLENNNIKKLHLDIFKEIFI